MNRHPSSPATADAFQREFHMDEATTKMLLNASLNSQNDIIILAIDREYRYYFFNEQHRTAMKTYYGTDVEVGMSILDAVTSEIDRIHSKINYGKAMEGTPHSTIQEFGDKNISVFESFYSPLINDAGEIVGATAYARDVTERVMADRKLKASEEENRLLIEAMNQGIANHEIIWDEHGNPIDYRYLYVNENYERMTGLKREDLLGRRVSEVLPQTEAYWWEAFAEVSKTRQPKRVVNHSAELNRYYSISFYSPKPNQVSGIVDDITSLLNIQQQLIDSELRYQMVAEQSKTCIWETDLEGNFTYISPVVTAVLGYRPDELVGVLNQKDLYPPASREANRQAMTDLLSQGNASATIERPLLTKGKTVIWVETVVSKVADSKGQMTKIRGSDKDITERKHRDDEILYVNQHDYLTRLYNRRYFDQALETLDSPENLPIALIMGDVNGLKLVNDAFGHATGDTLLIDVAKVLQSQFGRLGIVARIGGDEFCVALPKTSASEARKAAQHAKDQIEKAKILGVPQSISFGVAVKNDASALRLVLVKAEDDMYARKLFETASHRSETIKTILQTLHEKNPREEAHSKRVSMICTAIGEALGMPSDELKLLNAIGHLHDIGKIAIDERILNKQGKLDALEWETIKKHPEIGYRILSASSEYADVAIDILSHHERYDGNGYPQGLIGEAIPLRSRIIAIADAYDAMISMRTYKNQLTHDQAVEELKRGKGTQFDPDLVDCFLNLPGISEL